VTEPSPRFDIAPRSHCNFAPDPISHPDLNLNLNLDLNPPLLNAQSLKKNYICPAQRADEMGELNNQRNIHRVLDDGSPQPDNPRPVSNWMCPCKFVCFSSIFRATIEMESEIFASLRKAIGERGENETEQSLEADEMKCNEQLARSDQEPRAKHNTGSRTSV
jgi:hypothetical protein